MRAGIVILGFYRGCTNNIIQSYRIFYPFPRKSSENFKTLYIFVYLNPMPNINILENRHNFACNFVVSLRFLHIWLIVLIRCASTCCGDDFQIVVRDRSFVVNHSILILEIGGVFIITDLFLRRITLTMTSYINKYFQNLKLNLKWLLTSTLWYTSTCRRFIDLSFSINTKRGRNADVCVEVWKKEPGSEVLSFSKCFVERLSIDDPIKTEAAAT